MPEKNEKLEDILSSFLTDEDASRAADDIRLGDSIFQDNTPPLPSEKLLNDIKMKIPDELL